MSDKTYTPATTGNARVWLIEGQARGDHKPSYQSCMMLSGISQDFGDVTRIECPDPNKYNAFIEVGEIEGEIGRVTATLTDRYAMDISSTLAALAKKGCRSDVQLHLGNCEDPSDFSGGYTKALILESAKSTNYSTEDLSTMESGGRNPVNESSDISASRFYEVLPLSFAKRAESIVTTEVVDVVIGSNASCGDCEDEDDGCEKVFAVCKATVGSPSLPPDVVYSLDKGVTWYAEDITTLTAAENPTAIAVVGNYVVVTTSGSADSISYALKSEFDGGVTTPTWTEVTTGFVAANGPNDMWSVGSKAFIVGDGGYVYETSDPTSGVTVLDAGVATTSNLLCVHALSSTFALAGGEDGALLMTEDGETWGTTPTSPVTAGTNITAVWAKSKKEWWVGTNAGGLYYTLNGGSTWTSVSFPGSGTGTVHDISFATNSVVRIAHATTTPRGRILESIAGGYPTTWKVLPLGTSSLPLNDSINAIASCQNDVKFLVGVGLADDATDGIIVVGNAA